MKMTIEVESLDDLISLIGLVRVMQEKKQEPKEVKPPEPIKDLAKQAVNIIKNMKGNNDADRRREEFLDCPIEVLNLWPPAEQSLQSCGIWTVRSLTTWNVSDLRKIKHVGAWTISKIRHELKTMNIDWAGSKK